MGEIVGVLEATLEVGLVAQAAKDQGMVEEVPVMVVVALRVAMVVISKAMAVMVVLAADVQSMVATAHSSPRCAARAG